MIEHPASKALRTRSPQQLHEALVTSLRQGEHEWLKDVRDLMMALAPFHDCAQRLGLDVAATFRHAAEEGPDSLRGDVIEFGRRRDVTPRAFGYTIVEGADGPSYQYSALP